MPGLETRALPSGATEILGRWRARSVALRDGVPVSALTALAFVPGLVDNGVMVGELPQRPLDAVGLVLVLGQCLPLVARRLSPLTCLTLVTLCFAAVQLLAYPPTFASVGVIVALYSAGAHQSRFRFPTVVVLTVGYLLLTLGLAARGSSESVADYVAFYCVMLACAGAGALMRSWRAGEAERQRRGAELAAARERTRIARDLHDVVTHHVTAMVVQADSARFLPADRHADLMAGISDSGRQAMSDLRRLLDVLQAPDPSHAPDVVGGSLAHPTAGALDLAADRVGDLIERVRRTGQPVELRVRGEGSAMDSGTGPIVHHVVQEALTNAVKYAHGRPTRVLIDHDEDRVDVQVTTEGPGRTPVPSLPSGGHGLLGLGERVRACGGEFTAGELPRGGFVVRARLPSGGDR
ncbi:histidine kinase [Nocardiopsis sp. ATB16-24]|uniref:sensor histidine kinase n=1 Tax=Nocardiopsis sp. ATB16-24 TaxID=3019555 RepID=UPI002556A0DA|nr:histidine kinase [Nocardiopsis sp. ATB16-24]